MTKRPLDRAFNRLVQEQIEGTTPNERVVFIGHNNKVRESVYPDEFNTGELQRIRKRLEEMGELKAVVHIAATVFGGPSGHGARNTTVEYLPDQRYYAIRYQPPISSRPKDADAEAALERTSQLWKQSGEEDSANPKS